MEGSDSDSDSDVSLPDVKPAVKPPAVKPAEQVAWDDSDDEIQPQKKQKTPQKKIEPRLAFASSGTIHGVFDAVTVAGFHTMAFALNYGVNTPCNKTPLYVYRNGSPAENFDVVEPKKSKSKQDQFEPGRAELVGIAVAAFEIAEFLVEDEQNAAIVVSKEGGDAARLVAACVAQVVRRQVVGAATAQAIVGRSTQPAHPGLKKLVNKFKTWSKSTAKFEIADFEF